MFFFVSQTRGGPTPQKSRNYLFLGKIFKFQGGSGPSVPPSGSAHERDNITHTKCRIARSLGAKAFDLDYNAKPCVILKRLRYIYMAMS